MTQPLVAPRRPGPFTRWPRAADAVFAGLVLLGAVFIAGTDGGGLEWRSMSELTVLPVLGAVVAAGALFWRRSRPLLVLAVSTATALVLQASGGADLVGIAVIALYSVARYTRTEAVSAGALAAVVALVVGTMLLTGDAMAQVGAAVAATALSWFVGRQLRLGQERAVQLERRRVAEAARAVAEERVRIARELHDVVAHRVSLMTVQAGAARTVAAREPAAAREAMLEVERAGREALTELRHLLDVLRPGPEDRSFTATGGSMNGAVAPPGPGEWDTAPQPGIADLGELVARFTAAGLSVRTEVTVPMANGDATLLPPGVQLTAYRIVQEALTNVLRHAGPGTHVRVHLAADGDELLVEVVDDAAGQPPVATGTGGLGISGMRERAALLGGDLAVGPADGGGFRVRARLPVAPSPERLVGT